MTLPEQRLNDLDARDQIRTISAAYVQGIDKRNGPLFEQIWAEDAVWQLGPTFPECHGMAEIRATLEQIWGSYERTHHWAMNHLIDVDGDVATAETDLLAETLDKAGTWHRMAATHHDRYEKRDGRWLLVRRSCDVSGLE